MKIISIRVVFSSVEVNSGNKHTSSNFQLEINPQKRHLNILIFALPYLVLQRNH